MSMICCDTIGKAFRKPGCSFGPWVDSPRDEHERPIEIRLSPEVYMALVEELRELFRLSHGDGALASQYTETNTFYGVPVHEDSSLPRNTFLICYPGGDKALTSIDNCQSGS